MNTIMNFRLSRGGGEFNDYLNDYALLQGCGREREGGGETAAWVFFVLRHNQPTFTCHSPLKC